MRNFVKILIFSLLFFPFTSEADSLKELHSDHFTVISDKNVPEEYIFKVKDMAEEYYKTITQEFNFTRKVSWLFENRAKIFIAKDRSEYLDKYNCPKWSYACTDYLQKIIYTYPQQQRFASTLLHEMTHIIFNEYVGAKNLPLWLEEGVGIYMNDKYQDTRYKSKISILAQKIKEGNYIRFSDLSSMELSWLNGKSEEYINTFYLESFSVIYFLSKNWPRYKLDNFFLLLKRGYNLDKALYEVFGFKNMKEMEHQWIKFYQA